MDEPFRPVPTRVRYSIARGRRHCRGSAAALVLACAACSALGGIARAHEAPAMPPQFVAADCITVIDPQQQSALEIAYQVAADDTVLEQGDIPVPDAKTHQFFAFRGMVFAQGFLHELRAFDAATPEPILLPIWITSDDVKRAAQVNELSPAANFSAADIPDEALLELHADLQGRWLRITADDERAPITVERAREGARWELADVEPGLYTIAAYIFSPPYNGWAVRPGLVKIVDGASDFPPAAVIEPVHELVFSYQGKRVHACVDAPEGSALSAYFSVNERPEHGWLPWLAPRAIESDPLELCFRHPRPELTGSVRLRFDLHAPDGTITRVYSPDTITALQAEGQCTPTESICCEPAEGAQSPDCMDAGEGGRCATAGDAGDDPRAPDAGRDGAAAQTRAGDGESGGCAVAARRRTPSAVGIALLLPWLSLYARAARRGLRRFRRSV